MSATSRLRGRHAIALGAALAGVWAGCSFPEHTFIPDEQYYGLDASGGSGGSAATGGVGATGGSSATGGVGATGGSSATGGTAGGGSGGVAGGGTGGSAGSGNEDCLNGVDDDGDGDIDCEDSDCQAGHTCIPTLPPGWTGPVALYKGAAPAPDCLASGGYPTLKQNANADLNGGTPTCPMCTCGNATGVGCSADVLVFDGANCTGLQWGPGGGGPTKTLVTGGTACQLLPTLCYDATGKPTSATYVNPQATGGTCASSSTGTEQFPTPTWDSTVRACGDVVGTGQGCGTGICLPKPAAPFESGICIQKDGDVPCPSGAFSTKKVYHLNFNDTRDCSSCSCGAPTGASCGNPTVHLYTNDFCSANQQTLTSPGQCIALTPDPDIIPQVPGCNNDPGETRAGTITATPTGGTCAPQGGQVTGSATPTQAITFCCL